MSLEINYRRLNRSMGKYSPEKQNLDITTEPNNYPPTGGAEDLISFPKEGTILQFKKPKMPEIFPPKSFYYPQLREMAAD